MVGALGVPFSFLGLLDREDEFHDTKMGANIKVARHAMAIDEQRSDFEPTIWKPRSGMSLKQVWFRGVHSNVGGSYPADADGELLTDIPMQWMAKQAKAEGLKLEPQLVECSSW